MAEKIVLYTYNIDKSIGFELKDKLERTQQFSVTHHHNNLRPPVNTYRVALILTAKGMLGVNTSKELIEALTKELDNVAVKVILAMRSADDATINDWKGANGTIFLATSGDAATFILKCYNYITSTDTQPKPSPRSTSVQPAVVEPKPSERKTDTQPKPSRPADPVQPTVVEPMPSPQPEVKKPSEPKTDPSAPTIVGDGSSNAGSSVRPFTTDVESESPKEDKKKLSGLPTKTKDGQPNSVQGGTSQPWSSRTVDQPVQGGTSQPVQGGTSQPGYGGTSQLVQGGTSQPVQGGTSQPWSSRTVDQPVQGGTSQPGGGNPANKNMQIARNRTSARKTSLNTLANDSWIISLVILVVIAVIVILVLVFRSAVPSTTILPTVASPAVTEALPATATETSTIIPTHLPSPTPDAALEQQAIAIQATLQAATQFIQLTQDTLAITATASAVNATATVQSATQQAIVDRNATATAADIATATEAWLNQMGFTERTIEFGVPRNDTVSSGSGDRWQFYANQGEVITIDLIDRESDPFDTYLELYDDNGHKVAYDDDFGGEVDSRIEDFEIEHGGVYTIVAKGYNSGQGDYTLTLSLESQPATMTPLAVAPIGYAIVAPSENFCRNVRIGPSETYPVGYINTMGEQFRVYAVRPEANAQRKWYRIHPSEDWWVADRLNSQAPEADITFYDWGNYDASTTPDITIQQGSC